MKNTRMPGDMPIPHVIKSLLTEGMAHANQGEATRYVDIEVNEKVFADLSPCCLEQVMRAERKGVLN